MRNRNRKIKRFIDAFLGLFRAEKVRGMIDVLIGLFFGDEGKGKGTDLLAPDYKTIIRFQGGPNAGHTLEVNGEKFVLNLIPSGAVRGITGGIGSGVVLDPLLFCKEVRGLQARGYLLKPKDLVISSQCTIISRYEILLDKAREKDKEENGKKPLGTTQKGIGPTYAAKASRTAIKFGEIFKEGFYKDFADRTTEIRAILSQIYDVKNVPTPYNEARRLRRLANKLVIYKCDDFSKWVNDLLDAGHNILAEGAQGTNLDVDQGSYPYVTSSNTTAGAVCTSLGVAPQRIRNVYGVIKAYATRVGNGPFVTEVDGVDGEYLQKHGNEFGATTGRPRRCGWLDLPDLKRAIRLNGVTELFLTKLDVLAGMRRINVCFAYYETPEEIIGQLISYKGFGDIKDCRRFKDLPRAAKIYIRAIEKYCGIPVTLVGVGPGRDQYLVVV